MILTLPAMVTNGASGPYVPSYISSAVVYIHLLGVIILMFKSDKN